MRNLFKYGIMAFMFSLMFISVDSISAQSWKREIDARREYREDVRDARRGYRRDIRDGDNYRKAQREYRDEVRDARRDYRRDTNRYNNRYYQNNNRYYNNNNRGYWRNGIFIRLW